MPTIDALTEQIEHFSIRLGSVRATRKDLDGDYVPDDEQPRFEIRFTVNSTTGGIRITIDMTAEDAFAHYGVIYACEWTPPDGQALTYPDGEEAASRAVLTAFGPKILGVAESKISELARSIDCPPFCFPQQLDREFVEATPDGDSGTGTGPGDDGVACDQVG
ncbi:hypothetical protein [Corynebacterium sp.]|uniref:hypothetical protein n=1 Tax=Corynebacterium sp. TaxID=1720 RepID=UPI0026DDB90A|nr:hypothetical protein [Corynebacterium sp.]MDO4610960.1 hypothetical protein [Corynebacterium sp.]